MTATINPFPFKTEPFAHQLEALRVMWGRAFFALFMEQGTGKTKVVLDEAAALYLKGRVQTLLVLAPNGVHANWEDEIEKHLPEEINRTVAVWDSNKASKKWEQEKHDLLVCQEGLAILLMNVEGMVSKRTVEFAKTFLLRGKALMVVDESSRIKNYQANRTKKVWYLGTMADYRRILTGTPITQGPLDLFAQCRYLHPTAMFGTDNWHVFRHRYATWTTETNPQSGKRFEQLVEYQNLQELQVKVAPHAFRVTKEQCLDLPPKLYSTKRIVMNPKQARIYNLMNEEILYEIDRDDLTPQNVLVKLLRLQQITGGFLPTEGNTTKVEAIEGLNPKVALLKELTEELTGKAIVWARFRSELDAIISMLSDAHGRDAVVAYHGGITDLEQRRDAIRRFQDPESSVHYFVANQQAGGMGINLTQGRTVFYYSNDFNLENRLQSEDRAHRIGQDEKVHYIDLVARGTVDEKVLGALRAKKNLAEMLMAPDALKQLRELFT